jgi:peptidoglycan/xylan/chitin deacetylase (PgdA/CDA1 family)
MTGTISPVKGAYPAGMEQELYAYSPITQRPPLSWPGGKRVAFYVGVNVEHYVLDKPSTSTSMATIGLVPDAMNYGWRDYGVRVGVWRLIELLDRLGMPASVLLNSDVCRFYPQIVEAIRARDWAWIAHGQNNSTLQANMDEAQERGYLEVMLATIEAATGSRPRGWMGPALTETLNTPRLLAGMGLSYLLDWCNDDQPYPLRVPGMISVPYSVELNDISLFVGPARGAENYVRTVIDHLDQLIAESETAGRVMALPVHPFVINQPSRHRHLAAVLEEVRSREEVWVTTSDEIAAHYVTTEHHRALSAG